MSHVQPSRLMTTMSPSTKERLRRNLETFSSYNRDNAPDEKKHFMKLESPSIFNMHVPQYTKKAYYSKQRSASTQHSSSAFAKRKSNFSSLSYEQRMQSSVYEGSILPYTKDANDETYMYRYNAAKPLVTEERQLTKVQRPQTRSALRARPCLKDESMALDAKQSSSSFIKTTTAGS